MIGKRNGKFFAKAYVGKGKYKWIGTFDTRKEAKEALKKYEQTARPQKEETCDHFAARWLDSYPRSAPGTARTYSSAAARFGREFRGVALADVDRLRAREWAIDAPASVVAAVRSMFTDALNDGLVLSNPFTALRLPRSRGRKDITALTEAELDKLAQAARDTLGEYGDEFASLILVAGYTGMRAGELCALERGDLNLTKQEIHVRRALDRTGHVGPPKNGKDRKITCPPKARQALLSLPARIGDDLVFHSSRGERMSVGTINYYFRQVRAAFKRNLAVTEGGSPGASSERTISGASNQGLRRGSNDPRSGSESSRHGQALQFHELRHACATIFLERGIQASDVALQLGHTDGGRLVSTLYGHPSEDLTRDRLRGAFTEKVASLQVARESQRKAESA